MKNIAIFGGARSGKSTLAIMIAKKFLNYHIIVGDDIRYAFQEVLPNNNINSKGGSGMTDDFPKFLSTLFYKCIKRNEGDFNYIIETCDMSPKKAKKLFSQENTILIFVGTPKQTVEEHFKEIRKYETEKDWTYGRSDEHLMNHCKYFIPKCVQDEIDCNELNIWYVDTSFNRMEVLENTLKELEQVI